MRFRHNEPPLQRPTLKNVSKLFYRSLLNSKISTPISIIFDHLWVPFIQKPEITNQKKNQYYNKYLSSDAWVKWPRSRSSPTQMSDLFLPNPPKFRLMINFDERIATSHELTVLLFFCMSPLVFSAFTPTWKVYTTWKNNFHQQTLLHTNENFFKQMIHSRPNPFA